MSSSLVMQRRSAYRRRDIHIKRSLNDEWTAIQPAGLAVIFPYHQLLFLSLLHSSHFARSRPASRQRALSSCRRLRLSARWRSKLSVVYLTAELDAAAAMCSLLSSAKSSLRQRHHRRRQLLHHYHHHHISACVCVCVRGWKVSREIDSFSETFQRAHSRTHVFQRLLDS